jgi:hypothetical protein
LLFLYRCDKIILEIYINQGEKTMLKNEYGLQMYSVRDVTHDSMRLALREVAEGKLIAEIDFDAIGKADAQKVKWSSSHMSASSYISD